MRDDDGMRSTFDRHRLKLGDPAALLPLLHFVLLKFSRHVATTVAAAGYEVCRPIKHHPGPNPECRMPRPQLQGKTDQRFVENSFRLFRDCFGLRPVLTAVQFLEQARPLQDQGKRIKSLPLPGLCRKEDLAALRRHFGLQKDTQRRNSQGAAGSPQSKIGACEDRALRRALCVRSPCCCLHCDRAGPAISRGSTTPAGSLPPRSRWALSALG